MVRQTTATAIRIADKLRAVTNHYCLATGRTDKSCRRCGPIAVIERVTSTHAREHHHLKAPHQSE